MNGSDQTKLRNTWVNLSNVHCNIFVCVLFIEIASDLLDRPMNICTLFDSSQMFKETSAILVGLIWKVEIPPPYQECRLMYFQMQTSEKVGLTAQDCSSRSH